MIKAVTSPLCDKHLETIFKKPVALKEGNLSKYKKSDSYTLSKTLNFSIQLFGQITYRLKHRSVPDLLETDGFSITIFFYFTCGPLLV